MDDDADIVDAVSDVLTAYGYQVRTAISGFSGLRSLANHALPDCLLLDIDMPVMSGPEMAHHMLVHDAGQENIPIVLVSGHSDIATIAGDVGTRYFLRKPFETGALLSLLEKAIGEDLAPDPPGDAGETGET